MTLLTLGMSLILLTQSPPSANPVLQNLLDKGIEAPGATLKLPTESLPDGQDATASRAVLIEVAGDERSVANFVRDSVTAPFVLKTRDVPADDATIRVADLWFVVRGKLDEINLDEIIGQTKPSTVEAGNMRFTSQVLPRSDLEGRNLDKLPNQAGRSEWYTHATGRLLDRINVGATDHAVSTRTADSITVAATTSRAFDDDKAYPNFWSSITRSGGKETTGSPATYFGGGSYVKITNLAAEPGALFVEAHFAFVEPKPWFAGNPILRSKFSLICQDQVRHLRRQIQKRRAGK